MTSGIAPAIMKTMAMASIHAELKYPMDASWVENPPVEMVAMAWLTASNQLMPANL